MLEIVCSHSKKQKIKDEFMKEFAIFIFKSSNCEVSSNSLQFLNILSTFIPISKLSLLQSASTGFKIFLENGLIV